MRLCTRLCIQGGEPATRSTVKRDNSTCYILLFFMEKGCYCLWYDVRKTLTNNCLFNFILGNRGGGKTFSCKKFVVEKFLKTGEQFYYLRRYKSEIKGAKMRNFFSDLQSEGFFTDKKFETKGDTFLCDGKIIGYYGALSNAKLTSKGSSFPNIQIIIFDEYIIDKGFQRYLQDEVVTFLEFYESIARLRNVRVLFLGNNVTSMNTYTLYFNLQLPFNSNIYKNGECLIQ